MAVQATVPVLDPPVIELLFQGLESQVALAQVPFADPTSKTVLTYTVMYWEEPTGSGQDQLFPAYDLTAQYVGSQGGEVITVTDHTYIPAAPEYMRPYAEILATNTAGRNLVAGQHLTASAADATLTLTALGHAGLDFTLGSGTVAYNWYLSGPEGLTFLQTGQNLDWVVDLSKIASGKSLPAPQTLVLQVTDLLSAHSSQNMSSDSVPFNVMPPIYLPMVSKG